MCVTPRFFPPGQQVLDPHGDHGAERDLEGRAADIEEAAPLVLDGIDPVEQPMPTLSGNSAGPSGPNGMGDVLFEDGQLGREAAWLPDVGRPREPVGGAADDVAAQPQPRLTSPARLGL